MSAIPRIADLTPAQLARHATNVFLFEGRHIVGARLIYHALALDPHQGEAMRALSDFLDQDGTENLSAAVMEYALTPASGIDAGARPGIEECLFRSKWWWGMSKHDSGLTSLEDKDFADRSHFIPNEPRYREWLGFVLDRAGSLANAFRGAHTLVGALAGLLAHREKGKKATLEEIFQPERFARTPAYDEWLAGDTAALDELEKKRAEGSKPKA